MRQWTALNRRLKLLPFKEAVADTLKVKPPGETKRRERSTTTGKKWEVSQRDSCRPTVIVDHSRIASLRAQGRGWKPIAREMKLGVGTVLRAAQQGGLLG